MSTPAAIAFATAGFPLGLFAGSLVTWLVMRRKRPVCGCGHHHAFHRSPAGQCNALMLVGATEAKNSYHGPCPCLHYSGPALPPGHVSPEVLSGGDSR